jgi:hypothetical protein
VMALSDLQSRMRQYDPLSITPLQKLTGGDDMKVAILLHRGSMAGEQSFDPECCEAIEGPFQVTPVTSRKVIPPEASIGEYGVSRDQCLFSFKVETDASRCVTRSVQDSERPDEVGFL